MSCFTLLRQRSIVATKNCSSFPVASVYGRQSPGQIQHQIGFSNFLVSRQTRNLSFRNGRKTFKRGGSAHNRSQQQRRTNEVRDPPMESTPSATSSPLEQATEAAKQDLPRVWWKLGSKKLSDHRSEPFWLTALRWMVPVRYRFPSGRSGPDYSYAQGKLIAQRLTLFTALALIGIVYEETAPFELVGIRGPSMIPTMAADGSDLWLCRTYASWWRRYWDDSDNLLVSIILPRFKRGDIVGFAHPDSPNSAISCKRIVGLPGDRVQRYGQYVHLFLDQDPEAWGISWPITEDPNHAWINIQGASWDTAASPDSDSAITTKALQNPKAEAIRTVVVPDGHVWIESDCPALGLDSRQFGPIPITWIRTRVVAKIWPLRSPPAFRKWYQRPHPIPLDMETLMEYNVFYKKKEN